MAVFYTTLNQMLFLFALILIGFALVKWKVMPAGSATVLSKLENNVFIPALMLSTFMSNFTVARLNDAWKLMLFSFGTLALFIPLSILVARCCAKDSYTRKIYTYGLSFPNFGFMGNAIVMALFPDMFLNYLLFTLPYWILIDLWGIPSLLISGEKQSFRQRMKNFCNPMMIAMLIGMIIGLCNIPMPSFADSLISTAGSCMSPIAMLLTGMTVASLDLKKTFSKISIYVVSLLRLVAFPLLLIGILLLIPIPEMYVICAVCAAAMPLGLNTVVIPSAYGKDTTVAAGMALVSHLLSCLTIPLMFLLFTNVLL